MRLVPCHQCSLRSKCKICASQINPDGHCLFSAIADQLALLNILPAEQANYTTIRVAASSYISQHPDDFLPFLPSISGEDGVGATENTGLMDARRFEQYCLAIRDTAAWGGEPEVLALSRAYNVPIQVIQAGTPSVVTHTPDGNVPDNLSRDTKIARISFHRRMYGLGEVGVSERSRFLTPIYISSTITLYDPSMPLQLSQTESTPCSADRDVTCRMFPLCQGTGLDQPKQAMAPLASMLPDVPCRGVGLA